MIHIHPMVVHFPIALLCVGVACDLLRPVGALLPRDGLSSAGLWCTTIGWAMLLPAIGSGLFVQTFQPVDSEPLETLLNYHERLSYLELVWFGVLVIWRWDARGDDRSLMPRAYRVAAAAGALLVILSGYLGGIMVYQFGMGVGSTP